MADKPKKTSRRKFINDGVSLSAGAIFLSKIFSSCKQSDKKVKVLTQEGKLMEVSEEDVKIKVQEPVAVPFEENFPGYKILERRTIDKTFVTAEETEIQIEFEGIGIVLTGKSHNKKFSDVWFLEDDDQTLNNFKLETEFYVDGELATRNVQPLKYIERNLELFYKYELPPGKHELVMKIINPHPDVTLRIGDLITYTK